MIECPGPAPCAGVVASIRDVRRQRVEPGPGPLAQQMNDDLRADQSTDLIADANASILHDDVDRTSRTPAVVQEAPEHRKQYSELFVDCIGIEAVRDDQLRLRLALGIQRRNYPRFIVAYLFAELRMRQIFIAVSRSGSNANAARTRVSDDAVLDRGIERAPGVFVDPFEPRVGVRFIGNAEVEPALAQRHQPALPFFLEP